MLYALSYATEFKLDEAESNGFEKLSLSLKRGCLLLGTEKTIYSWDDQYKNFYWTFETINFGQWKKPEILLIGMGLGAIPYQLEHRFGLSFEMDCVEIHPGAVELACKYSLSRMTNSITVQLIDGVYYVMHTFKTYDLIIIDVCVEDHIPKSFEETEFLDRCNQMLKPEGLILFNRFYSDFKDQFYTDRFYNQQFRKMFSNTTLLDFQGTAVLKGRKKLASDSRGYTKLTG
jgi:spermidine synthase